MAQTTLRNPRTTLLLENTSPSTHARGQQPGDIVELHVFGGEKYQLRAYPVGTLVLLPIDPNYEILGYSRKWECFEIIENPEHLPPKYENASPVRVLSWNDFTARRHG